jgi:hypothetical protein
LKDSNPPRQNQSLKKDDKGCFLIPFTDQDNLHEKVKQYQGMNGAVQCEIYNLNDYNDPIYLTANGSRYRNPRISIYNYFQNPDTNLNNTQRHILITREMIEKGIEKAILKVCPQDNSIKEVSAQIPKANTFTGNRASKSHDSLYEINFEEMKGKPKLLILPCSSGKVNGGDMPNELFDEFGGALVTLRNARNRIIEDQQINNNQYLKAIKRYSKARLYGDLVELIEVKITHANLNVLFISGLYGLLKYNDHILNYKLALGNNGFGMYMNDLVTQTIQNYITENIIDDSNVFSMLATATYANVIAHRNNNWTKLWLGDGGRGTSNKERLEYFLNNL